MHVLARLIRLVGSLVAGVLVLGIALYVLDANESTWVVGVVMDVARFLAEPFRRIFVLDDNNWQVAINFGIAAIVYLLAAVFLARLVRRAGDGVSGRRRRPAAA